jgi:D-alanyl-D-alanine carboxypeptidase/D-alanyl-D-alanine-endopeptidase (penicillin-binding protein 4)
METHNFYLLEISYVGRYLCLWNETSREIKMRSMLLLVLLLCHTTIVQSSEKTDNDWKTLLSTNKLPYDDQAYCFEDEKEKIFGVNPDLRVRLASVSKLVTSLWSLDVLGANFRYKTRLFIKDNNLHIEGSSDPFMGNEKMYFLLSQLNTLGYTHFDKITFDKNFVVFPNAQGHIEEHPVITPEIIEQNLKNYFNTASWSPAMKKDYARVQSLAGKDRMKKEVLFDVPEVEAIGNNPFDEDGEARILTLSSPPLYKYLKEMNVESNNYVAQMLFLQLGGENYFISYMVEHFRLGTKTLQFYSGSGLPTMIDNARYDNYATCDSMLMLIKALKKNIEEQGLKLEDIVAVPGNDQGTFSNRIFPADYKNAFMAKSGTLMHTSTLAGAMSTKSGFSFYGIFNQSTDIEGSKRVQNMMVQSIMTELGGPKAFNYKVEPFDPYGEDNVKNLFKLRSEFLPVENNLY